MEKSWLCFLAGRYESNCENRFDVGVVAGDQLDIHLRRQKCTAISMQGITQVSALRSS